MSKQNQILLAVAVVALIGLLFWWGRSAEKVEDVKETPLENVQITNLMPEVEASDLDIENRTYTIDARDIALSGGESSLTVASTSIVLKTKLIPGTAYADIDKDGVRDAVVLLRNEAGGDAVYYYSAVVLSGNGTPSVSKAVLLGDRIRIKEITIAGNVVMIDVRERPVDPAFVGVPDVPKALTYEVIGTELVAK